MFFFFLLLLHFGPASPLPSHFLSGRTSTLLTQFSRRQSVYFLQLCLRRRLLLWREGCFIKKPHKVSVRRPGHSCPLFPPLFLSSQLPFCPCVSLSCRIRATPRPPCSLYPAPLCANEFWPLCSHRWCSRQPLAAGAWLNKEKKKGIKDRVPQRQAARLPSPLFKKKSIGTSTWLNVPSPTSYFLQHVMEILTGTL